EARFSTSIWNKFWKNLDDNLCRQVIPRLPFEELVMSSLQLPEKTREKIARFLTEDKAERFMDPPAGASMIDVFSARETVYEKGNQRIESISGLSPSEWSLPSS
ncbi:MAG: hypothetical protein ABEJ65_09480, partial [bacterium]